jgi:hypothetical protein
MRHFLIAAAFGLSLAAAPAHDVDFWRAIVHNGYAPPAGSDVAALAGELSDLLASPDPELRDEIAYATLATWIYQKRIVEPDTLRILTNQWLRNLAAGLGERDTDGVFRRSFSALTLSVVVARDNAAPFLTEEELRRIEAAAIAYLDAERDIRGYDATKGWMHSAAHTADLLKFIARSRYVTPSDSRRILDAIAAKLARSASVFVNGEDERFARGVLSIINRADFDADGFRTWTTTIRPGRMAERPTVAELSAAQNVKNFLSMLEVLLSLDADPSASVQRARDAVRAALRDQF